MSLLKAEAIKLIELHVDISAALGELMLDDGEPGRTDWKDLIQLAETIDVSPSLLATQQLVGKIVAGEVSGKFAVDTAKVLQRQGLLEPRLFVSAVLKLMQSLTKIPVEVICRLLISEYVSLWHVMSQSGEGGLVELIQKAFSCANIPHSLLQELSRQLVVGLYSSSSSHHHIMSCPLTPDVIVTLLKNQYSSNCWRKSSYTLLDSVLHCNSIPPTTLKQFYFDILVHFISPLCTKLSYRDVVSCQDKWKLSVLPEACSVLFTTILDRMDHSDIMQCLDRAVAYSSGEVHWEMVLPVTSCYVTLSQDAVDHFRRYITQFIAQATTSGEGSLLCVGLILARQAALEGAHVHPPYHKWFQEHFNSRRTSKKVFHFLVRHLTSLVPFEPAYCLRAHISSLPRLSTAQDAVGEYITLAQTRLSELNDCSESPPAQNADASAVKDVENMVDVYRSSGSIPHQILQASLFQVPYYRGVFLRTLLSPSLPKAIDPSGLIDALAKQNKIPQSMLNTYNTSRREADPSSSSVLPAFERVDSLMQRLVDAVQQGGFEDRGTRLLSKISNELSVLQLSSCGSEVNWESPDVCQELMQLADLIVNHLSCIALSEEDHRSACQTTLDMLNAHSALLKPIIVRLWELIHCQITALSTTQLNGVVRLSHQLWLSQSSISHLYVRSGSLLSVKTMSECCELVIEQLPHATAQQMTSSIDFCSQFLMCSLKAAQSFSERLGPPILLIKLKYLNRRGSAFLDKCSEVISELSHYSQWEVVHVDFNQWLLWELEILEDPLLDWEREMYHQNMLFSEFLRTDEKRSAVTTEEALCQLYKTLYVHQESPGFSKLTSLLQILCTSLPAVSGTPFLLKALDKAVLGTVDSESDVTVFRNQSSHLRILTYLPAYLLFTNSLPPERDGIVNTLPAVAACLKRIMVQVGDVVLDTGLTSYLCKGVLAVERTANDSAFCQQLLSCSPIFTASLACSWIKLKHLFLTRTISRIINLSDWINRCCKSVDIHPPPLGVPPTALAACLVKCHMDGDILHIEAILQVLPVEVVFVMADFAVRLITPPIHAPSHQLLMDLIKVCCVYHPLCLGVCSTDTNLIAENGGAVQLSRNEFPFRCGCGLRYLPVVFFKVVEHVIGDRCLESSLVEMLLPVVLLSHKQCLDLVSSSHTYQVLESDFIEQSTDIVKRFIQIALYATLQKWIHLSHSSLKPYIQLVISSATRVS